MRHLLARLAALLLILGTVSCTNDGPDYTWLRAIHAVPDGPDMRLSYEGYVFRRSVSYGSATAEVGDAFSLSGDPTARMTLEFVGPGNTGLQPLLQLDVPVEIDSISTVVLAGDFADVQPVVVVSPRRPRPLPALYFQFVHAAAELEALDVYVTAPDTELSATAPSATVQRLAASPSFEVPFGAARIRIARAGTLDVLLDSGALTFAEQQGATGPGAEWLFAIAPSTVPGPSPLLLIASSGRITSALYDAGTTPSLRAYHALRGAGPVDLQADTETPQTLVSGLAFRGRSALVPVAAGEYALSFRPSAQPGEVLVTRTLNYLGTLSYSTYLTRFSDAPALLFVSDSMRSVATEAKFRFTQLAERDGLFSMHISTDESTAPAPDNLLFFNRPPSDSSAHLALVPGEYFITVTRRETAADDAVIVLGPQPLTLVGGDVYSFVVFPPDTEGEPEVFELIDDRLP